MCSIRVEETRGGILVMVAEKEATSQKPTLVFVKGSPPTRHTSTLLRATKYIQRRQTISVGQ